MHTRVETFLFLYQISQRISACICTTARVMRFQIFNNFKDIFALVQKVLVINSQMIFIIFGGSPMSCK